MPWETCAKHGQAPGGIGGENFTKGMGGLVWSKDCHDVGTSIEQSHGRVLCGKIVVEKADPSRDQQRRELEASSGRCGRGGDLGKAEWRQG